MSGQERKKTKTKNRAERGSAELTEALNDSAAAIVTLAEARIAMQAHELSAWGRVVAPAALVRLLITVVVDATFETLMSKLWYDQSWRASFDSAGNGDRIRGLVAGFERCGIQVDQDAIEDYLALKYIRNQLAHAESKPEQVEHVRSRGFPAQFSGLSDEHWRRVLENARTMVGYVGTAAIGAKETPDDVARDVVQGGVLPAEYSSPFVDGDPRVAEMTDLMMAIEHALALTVATGR